MPYEVAKNIFILFHNDHTVFILTEACALIETRGHFFLQKIARIWHSGPNLAIKQRIKCTKLHRTLIINVSNGVMILNCYKELNLHELVKHFLKIKAIKFQ